MPQSSSGRHRVAGFPARRRAVRQHQGRSELALRHPQPGSGEGQHVPERKLRFRGHGSARPGASCGLAHPAARKEDASAGVDGVLMGRERSAAERYGDKKANACARHSVMCASPTLEDATLAGGRSAIRDGKRLSPVTLAPPWSSRAPSVASVAPPSACRDATERVGRTPSRRSGAAFPHRLRSSGLYRARRARPGPRRACRDARDVSRCHPFRAQLRPMPESPFVERVQNYIGGQWKASANPEHVPITNPATGEPLGSVPMGSASDVDAAVEAAKAAFPAWREPPAQRAPATSSTSANGWRSTYDELARHLHAGARQDARGEQGRRPPRHRQRRDRVRHAVADDGRAGARADRRRHRLRSRPPADGRLRHHRAVQLPVDGAVLVSAVRHRDRQHLRRQAERAGAPLAAPPLRAHRTRSGCRRAS